MWTLILSSNCLLKGRDYSHDGLSGAHSDSDVFELKRLLLIFAMFTFSPICKHSGW